MGEDLEREQRKYYCKSERKNGVGKGRRRVKIFRLFFKMGKITAIIKLCHKTIYFWQEFK